MDSLREALTMANLPYLLSLIRAGVDINIPLVIEDDRTCTIREETPLTMSARLGNVDVVRMLIHNKADLDVGTTGTGMTALHWACARGNVDIVRILVSHRANVDKADYIYETPLLEAICSGRIEIVKMLVTCGADMNRPVNSAQDSSLFFALYTRNLDVARFLIAAGADVNNINSFGEDLLWSLPYVSQHAQVIRNTYEMLIEAGCKPTNIHLQKIRKVGDLLPNDHFLRSTITTIERSRLQPKRLQQIARLRIRTHLLALTHGRCVLYKIYQMPLPSCLQKFLALGIELDQFCLEQT